MCEQSEGSLVPLVAWRIRYLRSLQTASLPENARTPAQSKKRKIEVESDAKTTRMARSIKRGRKDLGHRSIGPARARLSIRLPSPDSRKR